jgi:hypothetical protein
MPQNSAFLSIAASIGRIFFGVAIAAMGVLTIYYRDFPYMLIPPKHTWISDHVLLVYIPGALLFLAGACIVLGKKLVPVSQLTGTVFLLVFCFYFVPYEFMASSRYMHFGAWENAAKELAFAGGAFVIAGSRVGSIIFSLTILSFGIDHFLFAKEATGYMPAWISYKLFWMYLTGTALVGSSLAILFRIKPRLFAGLLGTMIFIWVVILHIPKVVDALGSDSGGEVTSAFLALGYCGIAFAIAGGRGRV